MGKKFSTLGYQTASLGKIWHTEGEPHGDFFDVEWSTKDGNYALPQNLKYNVAKKVDVKKGKAKKGEVQPADLDLAGLPPMKTSDGTSLKPLLANPSTPWSEAVWHCFPRGKNIGFAVRTSQARYVEWRAGWSLKAPLICREYYPLEGDGFVDELSNEVDNPAFAAQVAKHAELLRQNPALKGKTNKPGPP